MSALGDIAASQGKLDLAQGVEMLRASDDIAALGRATRSLSEDQLARGLKLAGIAGQLDAVGAAVRALGMPLIARFMRETSQELRGIAVTDLLQSQGTRALAADLQQRQFAGRRIWRWRSRGR